MPTVPIRVMVADDHELLLKGLVQVLTLKEGFQVVGTAKNGEEAIRLAWELRPDVILLDIKMPKVDGLQVIPELPPNSRVVILSESHVEEYVSRAAKAGALGYLVKSAPSDELSKAIHAAMRGEQYYCPEASANVIKAYLRGEDKIKQDLLGRLTPRERDILRLIGYGKRDKEIAERLGIKWESFGSVKSVLKRKVDIQDTAVLTRLAIFLGLVSLDYRETIA